MKAMEAAPDAWLHELLPRRPWKKPSSRLIREIHGGAPVTPDAVNELLAAVLGPRERNWRLKVAACLTLWKSDLENATSHRLSLVLTGVLSGAFDPPARRNTRRSARALVIVVACWVTAVAMLALTDPFVEHIPRTSSIVTNIADIIGGMSVMLFPAGLIAPIVSGVLCDNRTRAVRMAVAVALDRHPSVDAISALAEAANDASGELSGWAFSPLARSASLLEEGHRGIFPQRTVDQLCRMLWSPWQHPGPILHALGILGGRDAAQQVERLREVDGRQEVRRQAAKVAARILERLEAERASSRLLRPADARGAPYLLLHPVTSAQAADSEQLLRASQADEGNRAL